MADIEHATGLGYNNNHQFIIGDPIADTPFNAGFAKRLAQTKLLSFYFSDVDGGEAFIPPRGTIACAFQSNTIDDRVAATVESTGIVFNCAGNDAGWLHCIVNGSRSTGSTTSQNPVSRGTAGYVSASKSMFLNHRHAAPNTLTNGKVAVKLGLRLRIFPFIILNASDRWLSQSSGLCPGIVAVAWQANDVNAADMVAVTLDAAGDVIFTPDTAGVPDVGFLWAWTR